LELKGGYLNVETQEVIKNAIRDLINLFNEIDEYSYEVIDVPSIHGDNIHYYTERKIYGINRIWHSYRDKILNTSNVADAIDLMKQDPFFTPRPFSMEPEGELLFLLMKFSNQFSNINLLKYDEDIFNQILQDYIEYINSDYVYHISFIILDRCSFPADVELVPEILWIRKMNEEELRRLIAIKGIMDIDIPYFSSIPYIVVLREYVPREGASSTFPHQMFMTFFHIFRMVTNERIAISYFFDYFEYEWRIVDAGMLHFGPYCKRMSRGDLIIISKDQMSELRRMWISMYETILQIIQMPWYYYLNIVFDRYNWVAQELEGEKDIIDLMTALEALYVEEEFAVSDKLARRCAHIIGQNEKHRINIYKNMKKAYKLRSKYVHGSGNQNQIDKLQRYFKENDIDNINQYLFRILSQSIRFFITIEKQELDRTHIFHLIENMEIGQDASKYKEYIHIADNKSP